MNLTWYSKEKKIQKLSLVLTREDSFRKNKKIEVIFQLNKSQVKVKFGRIDGIAEIMRKDNAKEKKNRLDRMGE